MSLKKASFGRGFQKWWIFVCALLVIAIIAGGVILGLRQWDRGELVEINLYNTPQSTYDVYLTGAVAEEGKYICNEDSSLEEILQRAGGITEGTDLSGIEFYISTISENPILQPQKVNINTAEAWLLEALDGIGDTLAQRIIEYRESNGLFNSVDDLIKVSGIGSNTLWRKLKKYQPN